MITIRLDSTVPLGEQVRLGLREAVARGEVRPGDALPTVRQLANDLDINFNTVSRAYRDLEREGLVVTVRGRGTVVANDCETVRSSAKETKAHLLNDLSVLMTNARLAGITRKSLEDMFNAKADVFWPGKGEVR